MKVKAEARVDDQKRNLVVIKQSVVASCPEVEYPMIGP